MPVSKHAEVYWTTVPPAKTGHLRTLRQVLPTTLQHRTEKYNTPLNQSLSVTAKLLCLYGLQHIQPPSGMENLEQLRYQPRGLPYFADSDYQVSFSHDGQVAACVLSYDCSLGIDVQYTVAVSLMPKREFFMNACEINRQNPADPTDLIRTWSKKEAVFKALQGIGLTPQFREMTIFGNQCQYQDHWIALQTFACEPDYCGYVATIEPQVQLRTTYVDTTELIVLAEKVSVNQWDAVSLP